MLFASASQTLLTLARDPKRLGGELGVTMVLHTWTRELHFHPHVHAIVTGGGLSDDDGRWVRAQKDFLFPVRVMGALFRGKMLAALERAHARGVVDLGRVDMRALRAKSWIVYAKRPFGGPEQVLRYLGRYTHRVGISNQRLVAIDARGVTFRTKDGKSVTVDGREMLARFVQHVLPPRFVKIRHYGLHSASLAKTRLDRARACILHRTTTCTRVASATPLVDWRELLFQLSGVDVRRCPACHQRTLVRRPLPALVRGRAPPEGP
jgi:hypothetical protein